MGEIWGKIPSEADSSPAVNLWNEISYVLPTHDSRAGTRQTFPFWGSSRKEGRKAWQVLSKSKTLWGTFHQILWLESSPLQPDTLLSWPTDAAALPHKVSFWGHLVCWHWGDIPTLWNWGYRLLSSEWTQSLFLFLEAVCICTQTARMSGPVWPSLAACLHSVQYLLSLSAPVCGVSAGISPSIPGFCWDGWVPESHPWCLHHMLIQPGPQCAEQSCLVGLCNMDGWDFPSLQILFPFCLTSPSSVHLSHFTPSGEDTSCTISTLPRSLSWMSSFISHKFSLPKYWDTVQPNPLPFYKARLASCFQ